MNMNSSNWFEQPSSPRFVMSAERPVYLRTVHDGHECEMLVENVSMSGAVLMCPAIYGSLQDGQRLPDGELILSGANNLRVNAIVRWQLWPRLGVEFDNLSAEAASQISQLIETAEPDTYTDGGALAARFEPRRQERPRESCHNFCSE